MPKQLEILFSVDELMHTLYEIYIILIICGTPFVNADSPK